MQRFESPWSLKSSPFEAGYRRGSPFNFEGELNSCFFAFAFFQNRRAAEMIFFRNWRSFFEKTSCVLARFLLLDTSL